MSSDHADLTEKVALWTEKVALLTEKLSNARAVRVAGEATQGDLPEATLAFALAEIELECQAFVNEYLPSLLNATSADELEDALTEIRHGLRHLADHLKDSPYLREWVLD